MYSEYTWSSTSFGRASWRSILLITTIVFSPMAERLGEHEPGLGQRAFRGVDEQDDAVHQAQRALHLAAEVRVARGVDDVDLVRPRSDGRVLGEDGDALLALEIVGVHHALGDGFVRAERAGLPEHVVDERGLAVVDVSDDGDVTDIFARDH